MNQSSETTTCNNSEQITRLLIGQITRGELKAGDSLPTEQELGEQFGFSRLTVRESLSLLNGIGIVDHGRGRRRILRQISPEVMTRMFALMISLDPNKSYHDVFAVRQCIEPATARLAAKCRTEVQLSQMKNCLTEYAECLKSEVPDSLNLQEMVRIDVRLHQIIAEASGNPIFPILLDALSSYLSQVQTQSCKGSMDKNRLAHEAHSRIVHAISKNDAEHAALEMAVHLSRSEDNVGL